ncbi:MAG: helix-turn-helix transcriptional regulator [Clostridia bacterium]|nr:helix-turn-helix transcriptional regulator [Clostridia bacterium]
MTQEIAKRLSAARKHSKLSQEEAASLLGISRQTLSNGKTAMGFPIAKR